MSYPKINIDGQLFELPKLGLIYKNIQHEVIFKRVISGALMDQLETLIDTKPTDLFLEKKIDLARENPDMADEEINLKLVNELDITGREIVKRQTGDYVPANRNEIKAFYYNFCHAVIDADKIKDKEFREFFEEASIDNYKDDKEIFNFWLNQNYKKIRDVVKYFRSYLEI